MDDETSHTLVACIVVAGGTALGITEILVAHDGIVLTAMVALYGTILGYVFGRSSNTNPANTSSTTTTTETSSQPVKP